MNAWWHDPLLAWADIAEAAVAVERYAAPPARRRVGDWWRRGRAWCVHLDEVHFAVVEPPDLDRRLRAALSWTLRALAEAEGRGWRERVRAWLAELVNLPDEALLRRIAEGHAPTEPMPGDGPGPGRFVVLHIGPAGAAEPASRAELAAAVREVALAQRSHAWLGWVPGGTGGQGRHARRGGQPADGAQAALLFWPLDDVEDARVMDGLTAMNAVSPGRPGSVAVCLSPHRAQAALLFWPLDDVEDARVMDGLTAFIETLAAEAFAACAAFVGAPVLQPQDAYLGLATAVAAWRSRLWTEGARKVVVWGENPVAHLLQAIPAPVVRLFLDMVRAQAPGGDVRLAPELAEALRGLIAANLNVSEAARLLYLHRNTLMNRIERIRAQTGYDIRDFDAALALWLATLLAGEETEAGGLGSGSGASATCLRRMR